MREVAGTRRMMKTGRWAAAAFNAAAHHLSPSSIQGPIIIAPA